LAFELKALTFEDELTVVSGVVVGADEAVALENHEGIGDIPGGSLHKKLFLSSPAKILYHYMQPHIILGWLECGLYLAFYHPMSHFSFDCRPLLNTINSLIQGGMGVGVFRGTKTKVE